MMATRETGHTVTSGLLILGLCDGILTGPVWATGAQRIWYSWLRFFGLVPRIGWGARVRNETETDEKKSV